MREAERILFLGNSITRHSPAPDIGWHGDWGMAASAEENDYVHLLVRRFRELSPCAAFQAVNIADFERGFWEYDLGRLAEARAFAADLTILRIGENVDEWEAEARDFGAYYLRLLKAVCRDPASALSVGCFWGKPAVDRQMKAAAEGFGCGYLDISRLGEGEAYRAVGLFEHAGVAAHPSDRGMRAIADAIWEALG